MNQHLSKCINAAEMGLTQTQTATLLDIPRSAVRELAQKYGLKFLNPNRSLSRRQNENRATDSGRALPETDKDNALEAKQHKPVQSKAGTGRNTCAAGHSTKTVAEILSSKIPLHEKYELIYAKKIMLFEQGRMSKINRQTLREERLYTIDTAESRRIIRDREESLHKRNLILNSLRYDQHRFASHIAVKADLPVKSCAQMLDVMFRENLIDRIQVRDGIGQTRTKMVYKYRRLPK